MVPGQPDSHLQNNQMGSYLTPYRKTNSKWIRVLTVRAKPKKMLRRKHRNRPS